MKWKRKTRAWGKKNRSLRDDAFILTPMPPTPQNYYYISISRRHLCPCYNASTVQSQPWQLCHSTSAISEFSPLVSNCSPIDSISLQSSPTELFLSLKTELARATQCHGISVSFQVVHNGLNGVQTTDV